MNRLMLIAFAFAIATAQAQIVNGSMSESTITPGIPNNWNQGSWSDDGVLNAIFTYPVNCGTASTTAAKVTITAYGIDGDAKWFPDDVAVTPGATYNLSYAYLGDVSTTLFVRFTATDGGVTYLTIATLPTTNNQCVPTTQTITAPPGVKSMTMFPAIEGIGSLTVANFSLTLPSSGGGSNSSLFPTGVVSTRFDDGWLTHITNADPILKTAGLKGSFYIITNGMLNANEVIFPSSDNPLSVVVTSKKVTWSPIYTDPTQHTFNFSDTYTATATSTVSVTYKPASSASTTLTLGTLPPGTNVNTHFTFTLPAITGKISIVHQVTIGTLTAQNPLLTQPIGYMNTSQVLQLQADGNEIGDHTENHCDLGLLNNTGNPSQSNCALTPLGPTSVPLEINGARTALLNVGATPVDTFAYPYGGGAGNATIESLVKAAGIRVASSTTPGYNTTKTDPYNLSVQIVDQTVTCPSIQSWVDYAAANKVWLILLFHQIETSAATLTANQEIYGTTTAVLQCAVNYLAAQQASGKIVVDTVHNIAAKYY